MLRNFRIILALLALLSISAVATRSEASTTPPAIKVLVFWGSWCGTCPAVMAQMEEMRREYSGRNVEFVAVSLEGETQPRKYLAKGYGFRASQDGDALLARYNGNGVPWVVVTDGRGKAIAEPSRSGGPGAVAALVKIELDLRT